MEDVFVCRGWAVRRAACGGNAGTAGEAQAGRFGKKELMHRGKISGPKLPGLPLAVVGRERTGGFLAAEQGKQT